MNKQMLAIACAALLCVPQSANAITTNQQKIYAALAGAGYALVNGTLFYIAGGGEDKILSIILPTAFGLFMGSCVHNHLKYRTPAGKIEIGKMLVGFISPVMNRDGNWVIKQKGTEHILTPQEFDVLTDNLNTLYDQSTSNFRDTLSENNLSSLVDPAQCKVQVLRIIQNFNEDIIDSLNSTEQELNGALAEATESETAEIYPLLEQVAIEKKSMQYLQEKFARYIDSATQTSDKADNE